MDCGGAVVVKAARGDAGGQQKTAAASPLRYVQDIPGPLKSYFWHLLA
jgi:hypothetical protein